MPETKYVLFVFYEYVTGLRGLSMFDFIHAMQVYESALKMFMLDTFA